MTDNTNYSPTDELNPFFAKVIGFVDLNGRLAEEKSAKQISLLINVGEDDDVKIGERVLVFALGTEVLDPDSGESLGKFEIVRGEGKVTSVQKRMSIIQCTKTRVEYRPKPFSGGGLAAAVAINRELEPVTVSAGFDDPFIGDLVRFI